MKKRLIYYDQMIFNFPTVAADAAWGLWTSHTIRCTMKTDFARCQDHLCLYWPFKYPFLRWWWGPKSSGPLTSIHNLGSLSQTIQLQGTSPRSYSINSNAWPFLCICSSLNKSRSVNSPLAPVGKVKKSSPGDPPEGDFGEERSSGFRAGILHTTRRLI